MFNKAVIAQRINTALAHSGKLQKDLAAAIGLKNADTISYFCSGARTPNLEQLVAIAEYLHVTTDYLLGLDDCSSIDPEVQAVCKYTGLTAESVHALRYMPDENIYGEGIIVINEMLQSKNFWRLALNICFLKHSMNRVTSCFAMKELSNGLAAKDAMRADYLDIVETLPSVIEDICGYRNFLDNILNIPIGLQPVKDSGDLYSSPEKDTNK